MPKTSKSLSVAELLAELSRRQRKLPGLKKMAARLQKRLARVQAEIAAFGGTVKPAAPSRAAKAGGKKPRRRPRNKITLADAIVKTLVKDKPKSVPQIAADVQKAGYRSSSKTFNTIIYQTVAKDGRVKKVGRGQYVLKG
jgi:hypothetical protein